MPPRIFRLALLQKDIKQAFNFDPEGDTIPVLFDTYDRLAKSHFEGAEDDFDRLFVLIHGKEKIAERFLPRFSQIAFIVQMPHMDLLAEVEQMKGAPLSSADKEEAEERARYAKQWIEEYAPEKFRFELQDTLPTAARTLSSAQTEALRRTKEFIDARELEAEELHSFVHALKDELSLEPRALFSAFYLSFLGREDGPKVGWFLASLPRDFVLKRLEEASA
jgi:lysyl-tRNA synthetase, class I